MLKISLGRLAVPAAVSAISLAGYAYRGVLASALALPWLESELVRASLGVVGFLALAWLIARLIELAMTHGMALRGHRPPRLFHELIGAIILTAAAGLILAFFIDTSAAGVVAGSGMLMAIIGFALRKSIADVFSGLALGLERPFRIGDWIEAETGVIGQVLEINWRSTRLHTRNHVHVIVPNSRLADGRITNFSAPQRYYRVQARIILGADVSVARASKILAGAASAAPLIRRRPGPDVRTEGFVEQGIVYVVRFWISDQANEVDCRNAVLSIIDHHLRLAGIALPTVAEGGSRTVAQQPDETGQVTRILSEVEPFRFLSAASLTSVAANATLLPVPAGCSLAVMGSRDHILLVTEGQFGTMKEDGKAVPSLAPGDLVSLRPSDQSECQLADMVALTDSVLLALSREEVDACLVREPAFRVGMERALTAIRPVPHEPPERAADDPTGTRDLRTLFGLPPARRWRRSRTRAAASQSPVPQPLSPRPDGPPKPAFSSS